MLCVFAYSANRTNLNSKLCDRNEVEEEFEKNNLFLLDQFAKCFFTCTHWTLRERIENVHSVFTVVRLLVGFFSNHANEKPCDSRDVIGWCRCLLPVRRLTHYELARRWVRLMTRTAYTMLWARATALTLLVSYYVKYASNTIHSLIQCSRCILMKLFQFPGNFVWFSDKIIIFCFIFKDKKVRDSSTMLRPN